MITSTQETRRFTRRQTACLVVNIANPNAAGVSHNQYTQYNVDSRGLALNNGAVDQVSRQSQLAGQVLANTNPSQSANVILNEVVSPNRSTRGASPK